MPGVTRTLETKVRVSDDPLVYLLDTPGIMMPNIKDMHVGMKLAACGTLKDNLVGEHLIVDYLLFHLNKTGNFSYVEYMKLDGPQEDSRLMLMMSSRANGLDEQITDIANGGYKMRPNMLKAAWIFTNGFRKGHLGPIMLDL